MSVRAAWLLTGALLLGTAGCASAPEDDRTEAEIQWSRLEYRLESSPLFASGFVWKPIYDEMVDLGVPPRRARDYVYRAARRGPARPEIEALLNEHRDPVSLEAALEERLAMAKAEYQAVDTNGLISYAHDAPASSQQTAHWRALEVELERPPIYTSAFHWRPVYEAMCKRGIRPARARRLVRRSAQVGPGREEVEALLKEHPDAEAFVAALNLRYAEIVDQEWVEQAHGMGHFRVKKPPTVTGATDVDFTGGGAPPADDGTPPADDGLPPPDDVIPPADEDLPPPADEDFPPPADEDFPPPADDLPPPADEDFPPTEDDGADDASDDLPPDDLPPLEGE